MRSGGEEGLLSTAFHPQYASNGFFFVYYTNNNGDQVIARYTRSAGNANVADPGTAKIIITIPHPNEGNHNGGPLKFGPDGYLYIATGDGGGGGDPGENAQDLAEVLGKQLRLDINTAGALRDPAHQPVRGRAGRARGDLGVRPAKPVALHVRPHDRRHVHRRRRTGTRARRVDFQPAGVGGLNYGWDDMEGSLCYEPSCGCQTANRVLPIIEVQPQLGRLRDRGRLPVSGHRHPLARRQVRAQRQLHGPHPHRHRDGADDLERHRRPGHALQHLHLRRGRRTASCTRPAAAPSIAWISAVPVGLDRGPHAGGERGAGDVFTVTLGSTPMQQVTLQYATAPGTATAGADYTAVTGVVTFPPGQTSRTVSIPLLNDALDEDDETFVVNLTAPVGASVGDGQATGTITDDDPLPALTAVDCAALEGETATTPCTFGVTLTPPSGRAVAVGYTTQNGSATAGSDYTTASGTVSFAAGATSGTVAVSVLGDAAAEGNETFALALASPSNATLADGTGDGVIVDDDAPSLSSLELTHGSRAGGGPGGRHARPLPPRPVAARVLRDRAGRGLGRRRARPGGRAAGHGQRDRAAERHRHGTGSSQPALAEPARGPGPRRAPPRDEPRLRQRMRGRRHLPAAALRDDAVRPALQQRGRPGHGPADPEHDRAGR